MTFDKDTLNPIRYMGFYFFTRAVNVHHGFVEKIFFSVLSNEQDTAMSFKKFTFV